MLECCSAQDIPIHGSTQKSTRICLWYFRRLPTYIRRQPEKGGKRPTFLEITYMPAQADQYAGVHDANARDVQKPFAVFPFFTYRLDLVFLLDNAFIKLHKIFIKLAQLSLTWRDCQKE